MGFYMKKPIRFGFGSNLKGNYVKISYKGLSYRVDLSSKQKQQPSAYTPETATPSAEDMEQTQTAYNGSDIPFQEIESEYISSIVDSSSQELIDEINAKMKKKPIWPFTLILIVIPLEGIFLAIAAAIVTYFFIDKIRKTTIIFYDIDQQAENEIEQFYESFTALMKCSMKWHVSAEAEVRDRKPHAGAGSVVKRSPIEIFHKTPPGIKTNVRVPAIPVGKQTLYFFPERILIYEGKRVGGIGYDDLEIEQYNQRFIETEKVPEDSTIVDYTWKHANQSGEADKRFKDNRKLPVLLYSDIRFTGSGLNELIQLSKADAGSKLNEQLKGYADKEFLRESLSQRGLNRQAAR